MEYPQSYSLGIGSLWQNVKSKWNNMPVPEGKWEKEGNVLKLYTPSLDYTFLALISSSGKLKMIRFPNCGYPDWVYELTIEYPFIMR